MIYSFNRSARRTLKIRGAIVVTSTSANSFKVVSNNSNSNGTFNWITIGSIKGYENTSVKQKYINSNFVNDKVNAIYLHSKDFPQFKSDNFFETEKLRSTVKFEKIKDKKNKLNNDAIINSKKLKHTELFLIL